MNKNTSHILVVDDDDRIRELIKQYLVEKKFLMKYFLNKKKGFIML